MGTKYIIEKGWKCVDDEGSVCDEEDLENEDTTYYLYKGDEIWRFRNGRCVETSFKRFEDTLRKALTFGEQIRNELIFTEHCIRTTAGWLVVCEWHRKKLNKLGLVVGDKINIPKKFTTAQKRYALENFESILVKTSM